jgi:predicted negative regulator of RcsB-dependent stress response
MPHPGETLAFAVVFLPLSLWFGWRVWQEFAREARE